MPPARNFCAAQNRKLASENCQGIVPVLTKTRNSQECSLKSHQERLLVPIKLQRLRQHLNRLKSNLARDTNNMKQQHQSDRKERTRQLIQPGGILHKSGLMEAFSIAPGNDLQEYHNLEKAAQLLGFLTECFQENEFDDENLEKWKTLGEGVLRRG